MATNFRRAMGAFAAAVAGAVVCVALAKLFQLLLLLAGAGGALVSFGLWAALASASKATPCLRFVPLPLDFSVEPSESLADASRQFREALAQLRRSAR